MDTNMEADPFSDFNETTATQFEESFEKNLLHYFWIFLEILKFFLGLAIIIINILMIIAIARTEKLRKSRMNKYILFYAISNLLYILAEPIIYIVLSGIFALRISHMYCHISQMEHSFFLLCFLFGLCPGIEWYLTYYKSNIHQKLKDHYLKIVFIVFSSIFLLHAILNQSTCFIEDYTVHEYSLMVTYLICIVFVGVLNLLKYRNISTKESEKTNYYMHISTYVVCCWIPAFIFHIFYTFYYGWNLFLQIVVLFSCFAELFANTAMIFVMVVLLKRNKYYRMAFDRMFKKSKVQNYQSDDLDNTDSDMETGNQENPGP